MASASTAKIERLRARYSQRRMAAAAGESTRFNLREWWRIARRGAAVVALLLLFVPLHYAYRVFAYGSPFPMFFLRYTAWVAGARVRLVGTPLRRDVFFISNHVSWLDILALAGASGTAFVAKYELSEVPVIGWLCSLNRTVHVKRENRMAVAEQINALREALMDNWSVTVFPEGTTTDGQSLLPFKSSMLSVLEPPPPGVLVQPAVLDYGSVAEELGWIGDEGGLNNALRIFARKGHFPLTIHYLDPFSPEDFRGRKAIAARAREAIEAKLLETLGKPLRDYRHTVEAIRYVPPAEPQNPS